MRGKSPLWLLLSLFFSLLPSTLTAMVCYDIVSPMHPEVLTPVDCWPTATHNSLIKRVTNKGISLHERRGSVSLTQHLHQLDPRTRAPSGHAWGSGSDPDSGPDSGPSPAPGPASGTFRPGLRPASGHASGPDSSLAPRPDPAPAPSPASGPASGHASGLDSSLAPHPVPPPASGHASNHVDSRPPSLPHSTGKTAPPFPSSPPSLLAGSSSKFESGYKSDSESGDDADSDSDDDEADLTASIIAHITNRSFHSSISLLIHH